MRKGFALEVPAVRLAASAMAQEADLSRYGSVPGEKAFCCADFSAVPLDESRSAVVEVNGAPEGRAAGGRLEFIKI